VREQAKAWSSLRTRRVKPREVPEGGARGSEFQGPPHDDIDLGQNVHKKRGDIFGNTSTFPSRRGNVGRGEELVPSRDLQNESEEIIL